MFQGTKQFFFSLNYSGRRIFYLFKDAIYGEKGKKNRRRWVE
jgi:hypothetical protein